MSEKVLGFYKKDAAKELASYKTNCKKIVEKNYVYDIRKSQLVPVRLASESVDLKRLKARLNTLAFDAGTKELHRDYLVALQNIEDWAEKEVKKR